MTILPLAALTLFPFAPPVRAAAPPSGAPAASQAPAADPMTVEVYVSDKDGAPVRNLRKEDFRLREDGKEQEILSLQEIPIRPGEDESTPGKVVLILFDDSHLSGDQYKLTRDSAERFVLERMRPQDLFAVAAMNIALEVLQHFTGDRERVLEAVRRRGGSAQTPQIATSSDTSAITRDSRRVGQSTGETPRVTALGYQSADYRVVPLLRSLDALNALLAQVKGRKTVIFYSEEFSAISSIHAEYMKVVNSARKADVVFHTVDARGLSSLEGVGGDQGALQPATVPGRGRPAQTGLDWSQFERQAMQGILRPLARETGGEAIYNTSDFSKALHEADRRMSSYYILGFRSGATKRDGRYRTLEVKAGVKGATVAHRQGYFDPRPVDVLAGSGAEKSLLAALASSAPAEKLPLAVRASFFHEPSGSARVSFAARIPAGPIALKKKGGQAGGALHLLGLACAEDGAVVSRFSETQQILIDLEAERAFRQQSLVYRNHWTLPPGRYLLKLAVADEAGNSGTAVRPLVVPPLAEGGLTASSLVVVDQANRMPELMQNLPPERLEAADHPILGGVQIVSSIEQRLPAGKPVPVYFKVHRSAREDASWNLSAKVELVNEKGEVKALPAMTLEKNLVSTRKTEGAVALGLEFDKVEPGRYTLRIEVSQAGSGRAVKLETDLEFR